MENVSKILYWHLWQVSSACDWLDYFFFPSTKFTPLPCCRTKERIFSPCDCIRRSTSVVRCAVCACVYICERQMNDFELLREFEGLTGHHHHHHCSTHWRNWYFPHRFSFLFFSRFFSSSSFSLSFERYFYLLNTYGLHSLLTIHIDLIR